MSRVCVSVVLAAAALGLGLLSGCSDGLRTNLSLLQPTDYQLTVTASSDSVITGEEVLFSVTLLDPEGNDITADAFIRTQLSPPLGVLADGDGVYRFTYVDTYVYFASTEVLGTTLVATDSVEVRVGPPAVLDIHAQVPMVEAGTPLAILSEIYDAFGNPTTGDVEYSVTPSATVDHNEVLATTVGIYEVHGALVGTSAEDWDSFEVTPGEPASLSISLSSYDVERGEGVVVTPVIEDAYGNASEHPIELSASPDEGVEAWGTFVRFYKEGIFQVGADISAYGLSATDGPVLVDSTGPQIRVTTPPRGAELPSIDWPNVVASGSVTDALSGVTEMTINGEPVPVCLCSDGIDNDGDLLFDYPDDPDCSASTDHNEEDEDLETDNCYSGFSGLFSWELDPEQGLNVLEISTVDGDGNSSDHVQTFLWGDFLPSGDPNEDGIVIRLNEEGIDVLEDLIEGQITEGALTSGVSGTNLWTSPNWCVGVSWLVQVCGQVLVDLDDVSIAGVDMDLDPHGPTSGFPNGYLGFEIDVDDLLIEIGLTGVFSGSCCFGLYSWSNSLGAGADILVDYIWLDTDVGLEVDGNNDIQVTLANTDAGYDDIDPVITGLGVFGNLFSAIFDLLVDIFEPLINLLLPTIVEGVLPDLLEDALQGLEIGTTVDLLGTPLDIDALPQDIEVDDDGLTLVLETIVASTPAAAAAATNGSWRRGDYNLPTYGATPAFSLSMADNFINQLLHSVWQAGVIDFSMTSAELGLDLSSVSDFIPLSEISFETLPLLPPVVGPASDLASDGLLELALGDMLVNVYGDPNGVYGLMMQLAVTLTAEADLSIDGDNLINFGVGDPVIIMDFVTSDWPDLDGEVAENLMDAVVELMIPMVTDTLDQLGGIPIPELAGFALDEASIERETPPIYFITAGGNLVVVE